MEMVDVPGNEVGEVTLDISYGIIKHFSEQLYSSPYKAIEELVVNGYDARARRVDVYLPKRADGGRNCFAVWDDGDAMDVVGLQALWQIADSPKQESNRVVEVSGRKRRVVGKFGIGKLASYALGDQVTYLCKKDGGFLQVDVDFREVMDAAKEKTATADAVQNEDESRRSYRTAIMALSEEQARSLVAQRLSKQPSEYEHIFSMPTWTLVTVSSLRTTRLPAGRLSWLLGNSMPLRPDFEIYVDGDKVTSKLEKSGILKMWTFAENEVIDEVNDQLNKHIGGE